MPEPVAYIQGFASSLGWADKRDGLADLIFNSVTAALADAGRSMDDVETLVLAAHDLIDGRSLSSMVTAPAAGAYLRDEIRLVEDGLAAVSLAAAQITSGQSSLTVVAAWGRASEVDFVSHARAAFDPAFTQPFGLTESGISAMRLSAWLAKYGQDDANRRRADDARQRRAKENPRSIGSGPVWPIPAYPLRETELPRLADVACAMLIGPIKTNVHITGIGHGTDLPKPGDRNLFSLPSVSNATSAALAQAGLTIGDIDRFEVEGFSLIEEVIALESMGLAQPGDGFRCYADTQVFNQSGIGFGGWCYPAMGLLRMHEVYRSLNSPDRSIKNALVVGASPVGAQSHTAIVLQS